MTTLRRLLVIAGIAALSFTSTLAATATDAPSEAGFLELINQERTSRNLAPLSVYFDLVDDAQTDTVLSQDKLFRNPDLPVSPPVGIPWARMSDTTTASKDSTTLL